MAIFWPTPSFKGKTFELWVINRWVFNFCIHSTPLQGATQQKQSVKQINFTPLVKRWGKKMSTINPVVECNINNNYFYTSVYSNTYSTPKYYPLPNSPRGLPFSEPAEVSGSVSWKDIMPWVKGVVETMSLAQWWRKLMKWPISPWGIQISQVKLSHPVVIVAQQLQVLMKWNRALCGIQQSSQSSHPDISLCN